MKGTFTEKELALFNSLEAKKSEIQVQLNDLNDQVKAAMRPVLEIQGRIKLLKPDLIPYAEMQSALASPVSRDKYFPDLNKAQLIDYVSSRL